MLLLLFVLIDKKMEAIFKGRTRNKSSRKNGLEAVSQMTTNMPILNSHNHPVFTSLEHAGLDVMKMFIYKS
jgi:hypothetical protein